MRRTQVSALALALVFGLAGCDSMFSPGAASLRVVMSSQTGSGISSAVLASAAPTDELGAPGGRPGNGPVSLSSIQSIKVGVEEVLVLVGADSAASDDVGEWVPLTVTASEIDLMALSGLQTLAELSADAGVSGSIAAVRLVFGASEITFTDGSVESLFIPSGKVTIATPGLVLDGTATTLPLTFLQSASVRKIIRTGRGLLMPPVFTVPGGEAEDESDDD